MSAAVTLPCAELDAAVEFFAGLGFHIDSVIPADQPRVVVIAGHGCRLRLDRDAAGDPGVLHLELEGAEAAELVAPNGTVVRIAPLHPPLELPPLEPALVISKHDDSRWTEGRAGMRYRDLIPDRYGGRFIASHIHIPEAGPVPDYVHHHRVRFQLIVCAAGWVRVVYQDQGPPFVLEPGDAVLQPPGIRHRVLECSADLEVVEVSSPAAHETRADHQLVLPNPERVDRRHGGQRFVHFAGGPGAHPFRDGGAPTVDLGIESATGGLARAQILRDREPPPLEHHDRELRFGFLLAGAATLEVGDLTTELEPRDAFAIPAGVEHRVVPGPDCSLLDVTVG